MENARIEAPYIIFTKKNRNYPTRGVTDSVHGVSYRSGAKGRIDTMTLPKYFDEKKVLRPLPDERKRLLFIENCSGYNDPHEFRQALEWVFSSNFYSSYSAM